MAFHMHIPGRWWKQPLVRAFLGRDPDSLSWGEDIVATMADASRTYGASRRGAEPISLPPVHMKGSSPSRSGVTSA
jgi:hypothetical protein